MTTALAANPVRDLTNGQLDRISLDDLAALDSEDLVAQFARALPGTTDRQVAVAAFQSSI